MDEVERDDAKGEEQTSLFRELCQNVRVSRSMAKKASAASPAKAGATIARTAQASAAFANATPSLWIALVLRLFVN